MESMEYEHSVTTTADVASAWAAVAAVSTWPRWTPSMTSVRPLDGDEVREGRRFRISQPRLPDLLWRVTEVRDGESFTWEARSPGVVTVGYHRIDAAPGGGTVITIGVRQTGPLAGVVRLLTGARTKRYLGLESAGLKAAAEVAGDGQ
jgi:hypothetical protein